MIINEKHGKICSQRNSSKTENDSFIPSTIYALAVQRVGIYANIGCDVKDLDTYVKSALVV